jgi:hypothetical protein
VFPSFVGVITAINDLQARGLIEGYAISGAIAQLFWDEAIPTFDLDVLVLLPPAAGTLVDLGPLYQWAKEKGYPEVKEHLIIDTIPVQFLPTYGDLTREAVERAKTLPYDGREIKVVSPEYLCAIWLTPPANTSRRLERVAKLRESVQMDQALLDDLTARYKLKW